MAETYRTRIHAFVLMENHYHLLLELIEPNLSRAAQWLNVSYSVWFNRRHQRSGHLFQGRFKSIIVEPEQWALELSRYVHLNPVRTRELAAGKAQRQATRAGVSGPPDKDAVRDRLSRLRNFPWSSYLAYAGLRDAPEWLERESVLAFGGGRKGERQGRYREYVEAAVRDGLEESPWDHLVEQVVLGDEAFLATVREQAAGNALEQGASRRLASARPTFAQIVANIEKEKGRKWSEFRDAQGDNGRDLALYLGRRACGLTLNELAELAEMTSYSAVAQAVKRFKKRLATSPADQKQVERVCRLSNIKM